MFIILTLFLAVPLLQPYSRTWPSSGKRARSQSSAESVPRYLLESSNKIYNMGPGIRKGGLRGQGWSLSFLLGILE